MTNTTGSVGFISFMRLDKILMMDNSTLTDNLLYQTNAVVFVLVQKAIILPLKGSSK